MREHVNVVVVVLCCIAAVGSARASDDMRCGSHIIFIGAKQVDVLRYCGVPTSKASDGDAMREGRYYKGTAPIEHWSYSTDAVTHVLKFDQGVLVSIDRK